MKLVVLIVLLAVVSACEPIVVKDVSKPTDEIIGPKLKIDTRMPLWYYKKINNSRESIEAILKSGENAIKLPVK